MKNIVLGVSGSIAAYKALLLTRLLIKSGCNVKIVMTSSATDFVTPLSFSTLSGHAVHSNISAGDSWNNHVELGLWADAMIIAPATANTIGKMANGIVDNMLLATYLSAKCPIFIAPAMDLDMWKHPSTTANLKKLTSYGNQIIPVGNGELASGLVGEGRMAEPEEIVSFIGVNSKKKDQLKSKRVLITAGPTHEPIDPVRFIGNRSSGLMGISLAEECASRGAEVDIVLGPTHLTSAHSSISIEKVSTAEEMFHASQKLFRDADIVIWAAAVADYRPGTIHTEKVKKAHSDLTLELTKTKDIAATLGKSKQAGQILIGFALETQKGIEHAQAKLIKKNLDFIVLNSLKDKGAGFQVSTNKITIVKEDNKIKKYELKSKKAVAVDIVDEIVELF